ncbi:MAG: Ig-like domain-containing protein [Candidatus Eisenbacteria bacterium]
MRRLLLAILLLSAVLAACGKRATEPTTSGGTSGLPPALRATQPIAQAVGAPYDGEIWAEFDRPLRASTVTTQNVFLKLDGQRISITVGYDALAHRVFLRPTAVLALQRTYTVEFSRAVLGSDGEPLPDGVFFQFTTNSLRRLSYDFPLQDDTEGPASALGWGGNQPLDGNIFYDVYASADSEAVVRRTAPVLQRSVFTRFLPGAQWPAGGRVFWAVTGENLTTHERENGPLRSFRVLDYSTAGVDSVVLRAFDQGSGDVRNRATQSCGATSIPCGPTFNGCFHWNLGALPANTRLVSATVRMWALDQSLAAFARSQPSLWMAQNDWSACSIVAPGPPFVELSGLLANAQVTGVEAHFESPRLTAFLEAVQRRRSQVFGTLVRTQENVFVHSLNSLDPTKVPVVVVRYLRLPVAANRH